MGKQINTVITEKEKKDLGYTGDARIVVPDEATKEAVLRRLKGSAQICGHCRHFDKRMGQEEYVQRQEVFLEAYHSLQHDPAWYGRVDMYGACHQWDGHMPHQFSPIQIPAQFLDSSLPYEQRDRPVECPYFAERKGRGVLSSRLHYVGKRRNYEE